MPSEYISETIVAAFGFYHEYLRSKIQRKLQQQTIQHPNSMFNFFVVFIWYFLLRTVDIEKNPGQMLQYSRMKEELKNFGFRKKFPT